MARSHARLLTRIWADLDFRALTAGAQRLYMFLLSQPDLSHAGLIPMRLRRWAGAAAGLAVDDVTAALEELAQARFVVIDWDEEEVLVRTLMRNDRVARQPNVFKAAAREIREASPALHQALADELARIDAEDLDPQVRATIAELITELGRGCRTPSRTPSRRGSEGVPGTIPSQTCGDKYGEQVDISPFPLPHVPSPPATSHSRASDQREDVEQLCTYLADRIEANGSKRPTVTRRWRDAARLMLDKDGRTPEQIRAAIDWCQDHEFWRGVILSMPKLRAKYDQLRLQAQRGRTPTPRPSTTDQRVAQALAAGQAVAARLAAEQPIRGEIAP